MNERHRVGDLVTYLAPGGDRVSGRFVEQRDDGRLVVALAQGGRMVVPPEWVEPGTTGTAPL